MKNVISDNFIPQQRVSDILMANFEKMDIFINNATSISVNTFKNRFPVFVELQPNNMVNNKIPTNMK